mmetsp:Transcript_7389/g.15197  ORF Transcript_7389/g.15197 Transcript_7389/m.15197 type:complete len:711 (-) Transcript_7389:273-2405(-)
MRGLFRSPSQTRRRIQTDQNHKCSVSVKWILCLIAFTIVCLDALFIKYVTSSTSDPLNQPYRSGPLRLSMKSTQYEPHHQYLSNTTRGNQFNEDPERSKPPKSTTKYNYFESNDVLQFDHAVLENIHATYDGARSQIEWTVPPTPREKSAFYAEPHWATVDRRPIIVRKQLLDDREAKNAAHFGKLLGCAITSTTFVSNLQLLDQSVLRQEYRDLNIPANCEVCFQFSNRKDMNRFVPREGIPDTSAATKCFRGEATAVARFAKWQSEVTQENNNGESFPGYGYPWTVDCMLQNGIKELTCREITRMQREMDEIDGLLSIFHVTTFSLDAKLSSSSPKKTFIVQTRWPWSALMSHDDDRYKIAKMISTHWNDPRSWFVPKKTDEVKLSHVEGPGYDLSHFDRQPSLESMALEPSSRGGIHSRLFVNLFHLIRNAPGSTRIIAVVDGQMQRSYQYLLTILNERISVLYPWYWRALRSNQNDPASTQLIPMSEMNLNTTTSLLSASAVDITLMDLMRLRKMKIILLPVPTPSFIIEKTVDAGKYSFGPYIAARYAADYHVMMLVDGDTTLIEKNQTLQSVFYDRFFSEKSSRCAGHIIQVLEQYAEPSDNIEGPLLECTHDVSSNPQKWDYIMKNCRVQEGHIVARTDSIYSLTANHPDTLPEYTPIGVEDCVTTGQDWERSHLLDNEVVELHLRDRKKKKECACFVNPPLS